MDTKFLLEGYIALTPTYSSKAPHITVKLNDKKIWSGDLLKETQVEFREELIVGEHKLSVVFDNKTNNDKNLYVTVDCVAFEGIVISDLASHGVYCPEYPEPWATEQTDLGNRLASELLGITELGWNGTWRLNFTVPIFTWIHQVEHLGWIYD